jgi:high-affinity iron transporter
MLRRSVFVLSLGVLAPAAWAQAPDASAPPAATTPPPADAPAAPPAPAKLDPKKLVAPKSSPELLERGRLAYSASCVVCHGEKGVGDGPAGLMLNPKPRDFTKEPFKQGGSPAELFVSITEGVKDTPMAGWAHLSEEERWGLSYYVLSLAPPKVQKAKAKATP